MSKGVVLSVSASVLFAVMYYFTSLLTPLSGLEIFGWRMLLTVPCMTVFMLVSGEWRRVWELLRMLAAKGLVESRPKAGTRVRERQAWNLLDPELLGWMFEGASPPLAFVRSLFQLRMIVEPAAAELAALSRSSRQLTRMGHALEEMARLGLDSEAGRAADQSFHATILEATGNELLVSLSASIAAAVRWTTLFKYRAGAPRDPVAEHQALFEAIARSDGPGARAATETLVELARQDTERAMALTASATDLSGN